MSVSGDYEARVCAWCGLKGSDHEMVDSYDRGPAGPELVRVHVDCLDDWNDRTQPLAGSAR